MGLPPTDQATNLVTWNGPEDPGHPRNWPMGKKWATIVPMSLFTFLTSMSSAIMAPALHNIQQDLHFSSSTMSVISLSVYMLGMAIVPLFTAPLSEVFGRMIILQVTDIFFIIFNTLCGIARTPNQLIGLRFLAGLGGAGANTMGAGFTSDLIEPNKRGSALSLYLLAPSLGMTFSPIAGGFLVQYTTWPWCFYFVSIVAGAVQVFGLPFFRETYAPVLLQRRCKHLRKSTKNLNLYTNHDSVSLPHLLRLSLVRPIKLLATQPVVQVWSLYCAYIFGILYLLISSFPTVWTGIYGEPVSIGSLNYISLFLGMTFASQVGMRLANRSYRKLCSQHGGRSLPEFRLPALMIGAVIIPIGLLWYGWSARPNVHWIMPNIGAAIYGADALHEIQCIVGYTMDTYPKYASSAVAAVMFVRSLLTFALPLVAPRLYGDLGLGWGNTLLALIAVVVGILAPILLKRYGVALRRRSPYARDD
ncbi:putative MFS transporter [Aspergillus neoniger CBS 115656]|uniref:MFS general substrate transporter n=1 Tax=Aspergillus neoniger (strain CBS 115656) TaxID=1448310 RepID=A0A318YKD4_ASPNB|nr:MFS general substrate transporter [Aspergillus neoniger CBS 115656]PYH33093.1 MFS general substrate transporter [Aspergillus neoniger CBS 115656]